MDWNGLRNLSPLPLLLHAYKRKKTVFQGNLTNAKEMIMMLEEITQMETKQKHGNGKLRKTGELGNKSTQTEDDWLKTYRKQESRNQTRQELLQITVTRWDNELKWKGVHTNVNGYTLNWTTSDIWFWWIYNRNNIKCLRSTGEKGRIYQQGCWNGTNKTNPKEHLNQR